jgi:hypothetical protein
MPDTAIESVLWDDWHVVAELERLERSGRFDTTLLGVPASLHFDAAAPARAPCFACWTIISGSRNRRARTGCAAEGIPLWPTLPVSQRDIVRGRRDFAATVSGDPPLDGSRETDP